MGQVSKAKTSKTYSVMVKAVLEFNVDISAESLTDAAEKASKFTIEDVNAALPQDCYNDYTVDIQGVWRNE